MDDDVAAFVARARIRDCLVRLARGEDRRDAGLIRSCWWPDARYDYGVQAGDFPDYLAWVVPGSDAIANTQHLLGQSHIELAGDKARVETHILSYHRVDMGGGDQDMVIGGRYLDVLEERSGEWRIAHRIMLYDWSSDWGKAADWSKGLMGLPFAADRHAGRAQDDPSVAFFAEAAA
ncbi:nuclear transport factor 2 family protein [Sphingobium sp. BYY-5]|uniref:nuclear transport factor 2 family protein n=1 Tax=Sphingobium sp. BYY-5 TaxID=2926400 RepID=UPI001FA73B60|nr:nuclear transport factor 2 family protein [Sphingobium sp. BYY-5]MCI4591829.1 nuclear transport factor 2 family protein [Sphingobium sp. BYY-5]